MIRARQNEAIDPVVHVVTAPYATNPNLAAQGGLFTLVQPRSGDPHPIPDIDAALQTIADKVPLDLDRMAPVLFKFALPARETNSALRLLSTAGITAASIRPGLAGVVEAMTERWAHQWASPGQRF